jgi:hypothetical protein
MLPFIRTRLLQIVVSHGVGVNSLARVLVKQSVLVLDETFLDIPRAYLANEIPTSRGAGRWEKISAASRGRL